MKGVALAGVLLALVSTTGASAGEKPPPPDVRIASPASGVATNADVLAVDVAFVAAPRKGKVHTLVLELDGREVGHHTKREYQETGSHRFTVDLALVAEGTHTLRARAYQGAPEGAAPGISTPVTLTVDRTRPDLDLTAPADGAFVREASVTLRGTASDAHSGLEQLTCAGRSVAVASPFACETALAAGRNEVTVRAFDRAGNASARTIVVERMPGGLEGLPDEPAIDAVDDVFTPAAYVARDELTGATVRTQIELTFAKDATVGKVNALLRAIDGRIVSQREGVLIAVVRIPDPGSLDALDDLLASLAGSPVLRAANPLAITATAELPAIIDPGTGEVQLVRHQLAVRAHAAWNARAALESVTPPTFILADSFGDGAPGELFGLNVRDDDYAEGRAAAGHGYHVLGIAATGFDPTGGSFFADAVTGMYPGSLEVRAVDLALVLGGATIQDRLLEEVEDATGQVVVNTSLQASCSTPEDDALNCTADAAHSRGLAWLERVRGTGPGQSLEGKFLHVTAAGNRAPGIDPHDAAIGGWDPASAALYPIFIGGGPNPVVRVPGLTNTLVVESFASRAAEPFAPTCRSASSERGGTIAAIGESVHSFVSPTTTGTYSGTSMATPQVAGLAAYVLALRPSLSPAELISLLQRTGTVADTACGSAPPIVDAYAALLAADEGNAARPVRRAIVDAADGPGDPGANGAFDEDDLRLHVERFDAANGAVDYSRHDLNGDGRTGGAGLDRLDLDADGAYGQLTAEIEGTEMLFDERALTDLQALCWLAYSPLYAGAESARAQFGRERCTPRAVSFDDVSIGAPSCTTPEFPGEPIHCGQTTTTTHGEHTIEATLRPDGLLQVRARGTETDTTVVSSTRNCGSHTAVTTWEGAFDGVVHPDQGELLLFGPETRTLDGCHAGTFVTPFSARRLSFTVVRDVAGRPVALDFNREQITDCCTRRWAGYVVLG